MDAIAFYEQLEQYARPRMLKNLELLKPEEFTRPLDFLGGRSPRGAALHIIETEMFWIHFIVSGGPEPKWPDHEKYPDVESVRKLFAQAAIVTKDYLRRLSHDELMAEKTVTFQDGQSLRLPLWQYAYQVITHEFHHKGQLMGIVRALGYEPQESDFI